MPIKDEELAVSMALDPFITSDTMTRILLSIIISNEDGTGSYVPTQKAIRQFFKCLPSTADRIMKEHWDKVINEFDIRREQEEEHLKQSEAKHVNVWQKYENAPSEARGKESF